MAPEGERRGANRFDPAERPDPTLGVEKAIQDAIRAGAFEGLEGAGAPIHIDPSPDAVVHNLLREADVKPEWVLLLAGIEQAGLQAARLLESFERDHRQWPARWHGAPPEGGPSAVRPRLWRLLLRGERTLPAPPLPRRELLRVFQRRWTRTLEEYARLLHRKNALIRRFNLICPVGDRQKPPVPVAERLEAFCERFPYPDGPPDQPPLWRRVSPPSELLVPDERSAPPPPVRGGVRLDTRRLLSRRRPPRPIG